MLHHLLRQCLRTAARGAGQIALNVSVYRYARRMVREHPELADHIRATYATLAAADIDGTAVCATHRADPTAPAAACPESH